MSVSDAERRRDQERDLYDELYTMLDVGLQKKSAGRLIEIIKALAVIAVEDDREEKANR